MFRFFCMIALIGSLSCQGQRNRNKVNIEDDRFAISLAEKGDMLLNKLNEANIPKEKLNILLVAYKNEDLLALYVKPANEDKYKLLENYNICARSGTLGPKKKEGDKQVPEGFYHIDRFNPKSLFYLSLGINYPNTYDLQKGYTGSDIFIHGKCETVGCLPMTDDKIKEIFIYASWAKEAKQQQIPVYIFPFQMTPENLTKYSTEVDQTTASFWKNLQEGYTKFQTDSKELNYSVQDGKYVFSR